MRRKAPELIRSALEVGPPLSAKLLKHLLGVRESLDACPEAARRPSGSGLEQALVSVLSRHAPLKSSKPVNLPFSRLSSISSG
jgi:hypothetical protein